jgi:hypothetical protein
MTDFFYLKLGQGNCLAKYWLNLEEKRPNIYNRPVAAIYFGTITTEKIRELTKICEKDANGKKEAKKEFQGIVGGKNPDFDAAKDFVEAGDKLGEKTFITITHNKVYIFEPSDEVEDMREINGGKYDKDLDVLLQANTAETKKIEEMKIVNFSITNGLEADLNKNVIPERLKKEFKTNKFALSEDAIIEKGDKDNEWVIKDKEKEKIYIARKEDEKLKIYRHIPKIMPVKNIKKYEIANVPHVLATLPTSQHYTQGTCRKIDAKKDWGAIQAIKHVLSNQKIEVTAEDYHRLIELLDPYELETLVFLILKNAGLFVPAWRGGTQKGIDIIGRNKTESQIKLPPVSFEPGKGKTFQIKKSICKIGEVLDKADFIVNVDTNINGKADKILDAKWLLKQIKSKKQRETKEWLINSLDWVKNVDALVEEEAENETKN